MSNELSVVAIISPERKIHEEIASVLDGSADIETLWTLAEYPDPQSLSEIRKAAGGCVVFLDFSDPVRARAVAAEIDKSYPMAGVIALHSSGNSQDLVEFMKLGIREVVPLPLAGSEVIRTFKQVLRKLKSPGDPEPGHLYAFLPSKPGVGATTLSAYVAAARCRPYQ